MSYSAQIVPGGGLHPQLHITTSAPRSQCDLYAYLPLPPSFIPDRFQLAQLHTEGRLGAYNASGSSSLLVHGSRDLEGPLSRAEGSEMLLRLREGAEDVKGKGKAPETMEVDVPLHLRYQRPVQERWERGQRADMIEVELPWPRVFWSCDVSQVPPTETACPISALASSFNLSSSSIHFLTATSETACPPPLPPPLLVAAPTGVIADLPLVETINFAAIWLGALVIGWWAFKARKTSAIAVKEKGQ